MCCVLLLFYISKWLLIALECYQKPYESEQDRNSQYLDEKIHQSFSLKEIYVLILPRKQEILTCECRQKTWNDNVTIRKMQMYCSRTVMNGLTLTTKIISVMSEPAAGPFHPFHINIFAYYQHPNDNF